mmetsp:Transcript_14316/g.35425  ORF Transcript_14316/g.35425 Transcript_14316/m.35425 type:complete len:277 (+) Transcript_14316:378-1208(+)
MNPRRLFASSNWPSLKVQRRSIPSMCARPTTPTILVRVLSEVARRDSVIIRSRSSSIASIARGDCLRSQCVSDRISSLRMCAKTFAASRIPVALASFVISSGIAFEVGPPTASLIQPGRSDSTAAPSRWSVSLAFRSIMTIFAPILSASSIAAINSAPGVKPTCAAPWNTRCIREPTIFPGSWAKPVAGLRKRPAAAAAILPARSCLSGEEPRISFAARSLSSSMCTSLGRTTRMSSRTASADTVDTCTVPIKCTSRSSTLCRSNTGLEFVTVPVP